MTPSKQRRAERAIRQRSGGARTRRHKGVVLFAASNPQHMRDAPPSAYARTCVCVRMRFDYARAIGSDVAVRRTNVALAGPSNVCVCTLSHSRSRCVIELREPFNGLTSRYSRRQKRSSSKHALHDNIDDRFPSTCGRCSLLDWVLKAGPKTMSRALGDRELNC